jgi:hypothetical protein
MAQRHRGRFSDLERQFRESGGVAAPGSRLANYIEYKSGKKKIERRKTTKLDAAERKRYGVSLLPFNLDPPATITQDHRYVASISGFSNAGRKALGITDADAGYGKIVVAGASAKTEATYYPALIKAVVRTGAAAKTPNSSITGTKYTYYESSAYSIPFGRTNAGNAADSEEDRRMALTENAKGTAGDTKAAASVGYEPEVFRGNRTGLAELP